MSTKKMSPLHPGEILFEDFLKPMGLSQNRLALDIRVPARRINEIVLGKRRITADTALRLAKYFNMSPKFWLGLQIDFDLDVAEDKLAGRLEKEVQICDSMRLFQVTAYKLRKLQSTILNTTFH